MVFWKGWSWEVQTEAMRHSWGFDQEANLSSLVPGSLGDSFQSCFRDMLICCQNVAVASERGKDPQNWKLCRARWHI